MKTRGYLVAMRNAGKPLYGENVDVDKLESALRFRGSRSNQAVKAKRLDNGAIRISVGSTMVGLLFSNRGQAKKAVGEFREI